MSGASKRARRIRVAGWFGFIVLVAVGEAFALSPLPASQRQLIMDATTYLLPITLALFASWLLSVRFDGIERRVWRLFSLAIALILASEAYLTWYFYAVDWRGPQLPAPFELLQLGAAVTFLAIVVVMTSFGEVRMVSRIRFSVDVATAAVIATAAAYWWFMLPLFLGVPGGGWRAAATMALYPVFGAMLLACAAFVWIGSKRYRSRSWERLLVEALGLYGVGLFAVPVWYSQTIRAPLPSETGLVSIIFGLGFYLLFMAMLYRLTSRSDTEGLQLWPLPRVRHSWLLTLYPVALACALPVLGLACLEAGSLPQGRFLIFLTGTLALLLVLRAWLSSLERMQARGLAITDPVSGAFNFRYLHERIAREFAGSVQGGSESALVVFDINDFARINRVWGHKRGDELLRSIAELITAHAGTRTTVYRVGSDEFAVLLMDADEAHALEYARSAQSRVERAALLPATPVSLSAGIAFHPRHGQDVDQVLMRATAAQALAHTTESVEPIIYDETLLDTVDPAERLALARRRSHRSVVLALAEAVDARYEHTHEHSENVAQLAVSLATVLGLSENAIRDIELTAHVHDVGKIGVRDEVLLKAGALSADERLLVEDHPVLGERILMPTELDEVLPLVRHHHERWDGEGYPDGLRGPEIPVGARILAVCDSFEAMTAARPYRGPLTFEQAVAELEAGAGSQFDPEVAATFVRMVTQLRTPVAEHVSAQRGG